MGKLTNSRVLVILTGKWFSNVMREGIPITLIFRVICVVVSWFWVWLCSMQVGCAWWSLSTEIVSVRVRHLGVIGFPSLKKAGVLLLPLSFSSHSVFAINSLIPVLSICFKTPALWYTNDHNPSFALLCNCAYVSYASLGGWVYTCLSLLPPFFAPERMLLMLFCCYKGLSRITTP